MGIGVIVGSLDVSSFEGRSVDVFMLESVNTTFYGYGAASRALENVNDIN